MSDVCPFAVTWSCKVHIVAVCRHFTLSKQYMPIDLTVSSLSVFVLTPHHVLKHVRVAVCTSVASKCSEIFTGGSSPRGQPGSPHRSGSGIDVP